MNTLVGFLVVWPYKITTKALSQSEAVSGCLGSRGGINTRRTHRNFRYTFIKSLIIRHQSEHWLGRQNFADCGTSACVEKVTGGFGIVLENCQKTSSEILLRMKLYLWNKSKIVTKTAYILKCSKTPLIRIVLALRVNLTRILQN